MSLKHSIIMICYNQEEYIRVALDSVLCEQVRPDEIIIGDDCSTDGTRTILGEYQSKYPEIIKIVFNERNLGIFANFNNVASRATGDVISILSGDDWYKPSLLENMNKKIGELNLDPKTSRFILLPHMVLHQRDGSEQVRRNDPNVLARHTPVGSVLHGLLITRHVGLSRALFDKWPLFESDSEELGLWADLVHHVLLTQHIDRMVVMGCEGPVYRVGVGVASKASMEALDRSYHAALVRIQSYYLRGELILGDVDAKYLEFLIQRWSASLKFNAASGVRVFSAALDLIRKEWTEIGSVGNELFCMARRIVSNGLRSRRESSRSR